MNVVGNGRNLAVASVVAWMLVLSVSGSAQPVNPPPAASPPPLAAPSAAPGSPAALAFPTPPPLPSPSPVAETYFGTRVVDPYRYFENMHDPVVQRFFKAESDYTNAVLARLGTPREALFARIRALDRVGVGVGDIIRLAGRYFFEKTNPDDVSGKLYVRAVRGGPQRLVLDPQRFVTGPGKHETLDFFVPSLDGAYVAFGVSEGGSENDVTHVVRVADGRLLPEAITRTRFGVTGWDPSGKAFYYNRLPQLPPSAPATEQELRPIVYRHVLGTPVSADRKIFGIGVVPGIAIAPTDTTSVSVSPASPYAFATVAHGVQNEITLYAEPLAALESGRGAWRKLFDVDADVTDFDVDRDVLYLISHKDAPNFKVLAMRIERPNVARARTVVPASKTLLVKNVSVAGDGLYVGERDGGLGRIVRLRLSADGMPTGAPQPVRLPYQGNVLGLVTDTRAAGATFGLTGWTKSLLYYATRPNLTVADTKLKPPAPVDVSAYTSSEVQARSADGTAVPLSIVYRRGIVLDGTHPTYLEGYGAYGTTITPYFSTTRLAWLEHDGVYAVCHPRGGGWYGEAWHRAGMIATKEHTIQDFVACARYLVDRHYTSPAHLAGEGTSAGGILIGGAITQQPHLFAAALDIAGVSDALRTEFEPNGPPNIPEFGSVKTQTGFRALYGMDAYQHVRDGVAYPAVMLVTGINDPRVAPWELAKFAARLQAASSSGRPILLWVGYDSGHGFLGASREQTERLLADQYAFLLWQLGDPAFAALPQRIVAAPRPDPPAAKADPRYDADVLIQAGHQGRPDCRREPASLCNNTGAPHEIRMTPVVADEAARVLRQAGVSVLREPAYLHGTYRVRDAVFIHFDGSTTPCGSKASLGYPNARSRPAAQAWRSLYTRYWRFGFEPDDFTSNLRDYYGFKHVVASDAQLVIEGGETTCPAQYRWLAGHLKFEGDLLAYFLSRRLGKGDVPLPSGP